MQGLSYRQYAKSRKERGLPGGTHVAVRDAVLAERIHTLSDGSIDPKQADREWDANSNHRQQRKPKRTTPAPVDQAATRPPDDGPPPAETDGGSFLEAQRQHEWEKVRRQRLARQREEKRFVDLEPVKARALSLYATLKNRLESIGQKLAPELAAESSEAVCQSLVDTEIAEALAEISRWEPTQA